MVCILPHSLLFAQVERLPGEHWQSPEAKEEEAVESLAVDPGCVSLPRGIPDGRFRDGRMYYADS